MLSDYRIFLMPALIYLAMAINYALAESSIRMDLLNAKKLKCTHSKHMLTRWIEGKPTTEEGLEAESLPEGFKRVPFNFYDMDHSTQTAWKKGNNSYPVPVTILKGREDTSDGPGLTFIEVRSSYLDITTVFGEYLGKTQKLFMANLPIRLLFLAQCFIKVMAPVQ